jgi:hypothetical protein
MAESMSEPNQRPRDPRWARAGLSALMLVAVVASGACRGRAERLYDRAQQHVQRSEFDEAVALYEEILERYPESEASVRARDEIELYRGLSNAVDFYGARKVYDQMIRTARAVYRHESRRGRWPGSLAELAPGELDEVPVDPWGRELLYRPKPRGRGYVLGCYGSDGRPGGAGAARDWYIEDGGFVRQPSVDLP